MNEIYNNIKINFLKSKNNRHETICNATCHCGRIFYTKYSQLKRGNTKSCGCSKNIRRVSDIVYGVEILEEIKIKNKRKKFKCKCICGNIFIHSLHIKSKNIESKIINCGECYFKPGLIFNNIKYIEKTDKKASDKTYICRFVCHCGREFLASMSKIKNGFQLSCGCSGTKSLVGQTIGNFKVIKLLPKNTTKRQAFIYECQDNNGNIHFIKHSELFYKNSRSECDIFRLSVILKYKRKCFICKSKKNVVAHHLDGYHWCIEKRTDIENGVCLCEQCHTDFHSKYGNRNNTKEQFLEFKAKYESM